MLRAAGGVLLRHILLLFARSTCDLGDAAGAASAEPLAAVQRVASDSVDETTTSSPIVVAAGQRKPRVRCLSLGVVSNWSSTALRAGGPQAHALELRP